MKIKIHKRTQNANIHIHESYKDRLIKYLHDYDCALLTAFRKQIKNVTDGTYSVVADYVNDPVYLSTWIDEDEKVCSPRTPGATQGMVPKTKNREWNCMLRATQLRKGYGITNVHGLYREDGWDAASDEESLFIVNLKDDPNFVDTIKKLGEAFNQDCVLIKEKGSDEAYVYGTNASSNPGYKVTKYIGKLVEDVPLTYYGSSTSIRNKAFAFKEDEGFRGCPIDLERFGLCNFLSKGLIRQESLHLMTELGI
jgi:hypothetical protein